MTIPKAFISYSHDTLEHKKWVLELASRLRNNGIDAILDQFELQPGDDVPHFMEKNLVSADKILMICTDKYVAKANAGEGGVGYEKMIITSNLLKKIDENKIIPIIRQDTSSDVPIFLRSKLYINFSKLDDFEFSYDELVRTIHKSPLFEKPPIGNNPFAGIKKERLIDDISLINTIIEHAAVSYNSLNGLKIIYMEGFIREFKISRIFAEVLIEKIIAMGYLEWVKENYAFIISKKGKHYAYENNLAK